MVLCGQSFVCGFVFVCVCGCVTNYEPEKAIET